MTSATARVSAEASWSVAAKVATVGGTLGVSVVAARLLGPDDFGTWSLARNLVVYVVLLGAFGLDRALLRFVPELEARSAGAALRRMVGATLATQVVLALVVGSAVVALRPLAERTLGPAVASLLPAVAVLAVVLILKESLYQLHFALGRARVLATATTLTGVAWVGLTAWFLLAGQGPGGALGAQTLALAAAVVLLVPSALAALARVPRLASATIPSSRVGTFAATVVASGLVNLIVQRQSEVFFLAATATPAVVGFYDLGYSLPQLALELVPLSLYAVVLSAMSAAVTRDPARLGQLVGWYYKLLALVTVPVALLGVAWADRLLVLLYGPEMAPAGPIAQIFSLVHLLPFVSVPIGTALLVSEKAHRTIHLGLLQVAVNVLLDLLLIPPFGVAGAIAAVALTFFLVTPVTIRIALRHTGPLELPFAWIGRLALALAPGLLPALTRPWIQGPGALAAAVGASLALMVVGLRRSSLFGPEELSRLDRLRGPLGVAARALLVRSS